MTQAKKPTKEDIVSAIKEMTISEIVELLKALEQELGVSHGRD